MVFIWTETVENFRTSLLSKRGLSETSEENKGFLQVESPPDPRMTRSHTILRRGMGIVKCSQLSKWLRGATCIAKQWLFKLNDLNCSLQNI